MSKKSKKQTEEKVPAKAKPATVTLAKSKGDGEKKVVSKVRDNLDALFKEAKEKKVVNEEKKKKEAKKEEKRKKKEFEAINEMKAVNGDPIGYDEESGMKVYRVDQLNLGKGGNTPLCPFDCDCCY